MAENKTARFVGNAAHRLLESPVVAVDEEVDQRQNVFFAVAQRRNKNGNDRQPVIEILAELLFAHGFFQIAIGGCDHAHIHLHIANAANAPDHLVFQHAQQFGLQQRRKLANFVEKQRASVRRLEQALLHLLGVGERAFFVAEKFGFHQRLGNRGAVDGDERFVLAGTFIVNGLGDEVFAGAAFALNQNGCSFAGRNLADEVHELGHLG